MFIWDFVADKILGQIVDWFYGQVVGFLGNFFAEMGNMGAELFTMDWVQSIVLFFSYLAWALYGTGLVVACFETGVEYSSGRGNIREMRSAKVVGLLGDSRLSGLAVRDQITGKEAELPVTGVFVNIGRVPDTEPFVHLVQCDGHGFFLTDESCATNVPGIWAAGDCRQKAVRQLTTAAADGAIAAVNACRYLG